MGTKIFFDNKVVKLPGAYSTIVSGEQSQPITLDYGKVLVLDTGVVGATWGGGSGITGDLATGKDSIYTFNDLGEYQAFLKGGLFWKTAKALFKPDEKTGATGVSQIIHVKCATTTKSLMTFTATGGGANGGTFKFNPKDEGVIANGVLTSTHLDKGYAYKVETGVVDTAKWLIKIYLGSWTGNHVDGISFNEISKADSQAKLILVSPEFNNIQTLLDWAATNSAFGSKFILDSTSAVAGTGVVDAADIALYTGYTLSAGGTETYDLASLNLALDALIEEDFSFILCDQYGEDDYNSAEVSAITSFINNESKFKRFLYVGGGANEDEFTSADGSLAMGAYFNSSYVHVIHGEVGLASDQVSGGFRYFPSMLHAAFMVGRTAGKQPQIPSTNKSLGIDVLRHSLTLKQQEKALDAGVKVTVWNRYVKRFVCLQDVNTLQDNTRLFTPQGKSFQGSFMRIVEQINKDLVVSAETDLLYNENGNNRNTLSAGYIVAWTEVQLKSKLATVSEDNLLLSFKNVTATVVGDSYSVGYGIVVNNEVNKIFFTGFLFS